MASPLDDINKLNLTPQEQNLYQHHLDNLHGTGKVRNPDGTISTMLQAVVPGPGGRYYNIPTVWGGQELDVHSARQLAAQQGWNKWPSYATPETADLRYETMHDFLERDTERYQQATAPLGSFKRGGRVKKTGVYKVHKGEKVVPARAAKAPAKRATSAKRTAEMRSRTRRPVTPRMAVRPRRRRLSRALPVAAPGPALGPPGVGPGLPPGGPPGMPPGGGGIPMMKKGGKVKRTGPHMLHKGEKVVPAHKAKGATHKPKEEMGMGAAVRRGKFPPRKKK